MRPEPRDLVRLVPGGARPLDVRSLHGDGSSRRFYRIRTEAGSLVLLEGPDPQENAGYVRVACHLAERGIRVPRVHGVDEARGWILLEDLGDRSLFAALREQGGDPTALYPPVLDLLVRMQVLGAQGFDATVGYAPGPYDAQLMVEGEALYFAREFAAGLLGLVAPSEFRGDAERLAGEAAQASPQFFLHRDFQSRNIHITPSGPALIDFQNARPGPLAYDVAALILDPYADLPAELRAQLLSAYRERLEKLGADPGEVDRGWFPLGTFRLLQALGAFAKLGGRLGKPGFLEHAGNALDRLLEHLGERGRREFPSLWGLSERSREVWRRLEEKGRPGGQAS